MNLESSYSRRKMIGFIGTAFGTLLFSGCDRGPFGSKVWGSLFSKKQTRHSKPPCIVRPEQTEGPYFVDELLNRSDIRSDPSDGSSKEGFRLELVIRVHDLREDNCLPLAGARVDIWHCDAQGLYSDVRDRSFNTKGKKFLRGYQLTDRAGMAQFVTIYPGWYPGRAVHIHFKIRTNPDSGRGEEFTSQIYFEDELSDQIHAKEPYVKTGEGRLKNRQDGIYRDGGEELIFKPTLDLRGYSGIFDIGLSRS